MLISCEEAALVPENNYLPDEFFASTEAYNATKTALDGNNNVVWSEGDQVIAFTKSTRVSRFQIQEKYIGNTAGAFSQISGPNSTSSFVPEQDLAHNIMLYPYSGDVKCKINDNENLSYKLNVVLPEVQSYTENSFSNGAFPMVAVSESNNLSFKNVCGGLKIQLKGVDKIESIKLEGLGNEKLAGPATVVGYADGSNPTIAMGGSATTGIILDCGEGVQLDETNPTTFIISVPPVTFAAGMKITVTDTEGFSRILANSSENTIQRSSLLAFPAITYKQEGVFELPEGAVESVEVTTEGGNVEIPIITNQDYEVKIPEVASDWISIVGTKAVREETIVLHVEANTTPEDRSAEVVIATTEGEVLQSITIAQEGIKDVQSNNEIWYTSSNGKIITPYSSSAFGANIVSNTYTDGKGVITFDKDLTQLGNQAFQNCWYITSMTLPESLVSIGAQAFTSCYDMTYIHIPDNVTSIGNDAFYGCLKLNDLTLPKGLTSLGERALGQCEGLTEICVPSGISTLSNSTFQYCKNLSSVSLPENLTSIGEFAFNGCSSLISITIPDSVTSIGELAFSGCTNLQEFNNINASSDKRSMIFDGVLNCFAPGGITEYVIPVGVTSIGRYAFSSCSNLTSVTLSKDVTKVEYGAFMYCTGELVIDCNDVSCDSSNSFTELTINEGVTSIIKSAFAGFAKLARTTIPSSITTIGQNAFANCTGEVVVNCTPPTQALYNSAFTKVTIGDNVKSIGKEAFLQCYKLKEVVIPESVTSIGVMAFSGCGQLECITIPSRVTFIGYSAFISCDKLSTIYCKPATPPSTTANLNINSSTKIYVPVGAGDAYRNASFWSTYASMIEELEM